MRRVPIHRIKQRQAYSIVEVADLLGVHKNTVRQWLRDGLCPMDNIRPILIHGAVLKQFLLDKRSSKKSSCLPHEFYCLKCRVPRAPWEGVIDVTIRTLRLFRTHAICEVCGTEIHKTAGQEKLMIMLKTLCAQQVQPKHLIETLPPNLKCYLEERAKL